MGRYYVDDSIKAEKVVIMPSFVIIKLKSGGRMKYWRDPFKNYEKKPPNKDTIIQLPDGSYRPISEFFEME